MRNRDAVDSAALLDHHPEVVGPPHIAVIIVRSDLEVAGLGANSYEIASRIDVEIPV